MYYSPVPLIIIRADCPALIEVNGQLLGECGEGAHVAMPASDTAMPMGREYGFGLRSV